MTDRKRRSDDLPGQLLIANDRIGALEDETGELRARIAELEEENRKLRASEAGYLLGYSQRGDRIAELRALLRWLLAESTYMRPEARRRIDAALGEKP